MDDDLYGLPLAAFTAERDALAARLKAAGDKSGAAAAKALRKPSVAAWAANQVVRHASAEWQRLQAAARALRRAHEHAVPGEELRAASREQREALQACEARAAEQLVRDGHAIGPGLLQKVGGTLLALAYGAPGATPGRLEQELQPPGFEVMAGVALAGVAPATKAAVPPPTAAPGPTAAPRPDAPPSLEEQEERARRRAALAAAESRMAESRRALDEARARLAASEQRRLELERELDAALQACEDARRRLESAEAQHASAAAALREEREADHSAR